MRPGFGIGDFCGPGQSCFGRRGRQFARVNGDSSVLHGTVFEVVQPFNWFLRAFLGPYLDKVSTLPMDAWDQPFQYEIVDPATDSFKIFSAGPDRQPGSSDDISTTL